MKTCQICGLPILSEQDEQQCNSLHAIEAREVIKEDYKKFAIEDSFDDVSEWVKNNPGDIEFCCEFCGIYKASRPKCNKCEE